MLRAALRDADGNLVQDERFQENMSGAKSAGLHTGCYVDLDADSEESAEEIADFVLSHLTLSQQEMGAPVAVRVQIPAHTSSLSGQTREEWTRSVRAFCAKIQKAGYEPVIYANTAAFYMLDYLYFPYQFDCWQYSLKGTVEGIEGDVSLDLRVHTRTDEEIKE